VKDSRTSKTLEQNLKKYLSISIASILAFSAPGIAKAQLYVTATVGGVPTVSGATLENFDETTPSILTLSGPAYLLTGSDGVATPPYFSGSTAAFFGESPTIGYDNSQYVAVESTGSATLSFSIPQYYLGLLWGSVDQDNLNFLTFYDSANNVIGTVGGGDIWTQFGNEPPPTGTAYVNITSTTAFSSVVATDPWGIPESFEFDDVAYAQVVPEPSSLSLLAFGMFGIALLRRHRG
jgi:hypothetical protein